MGDSLFDDVKALLDGEFGDDRILKQIFRACENNEVISNYERNYVQKLAEKHLGKKPAKGPLSEPKSKHSSNNPVFSTPPTMIQKPQVLQATPKISASSNPNRTKISIAIGAAVVLAVIATMGVYLGNIDGVSPSEKNPSIPALDSPYVRTDLPSYATKDLISVRGSSESTGTMNLSITNQKNEIVWIEQAPLKNNGEYSTLLIAGGEGWELSGTYTIKADNGEESSLYAFSFTS